MELSFIIVDDNELDCFIARKIIKHTDENLPITTFQDANKLIEFEYEPGVLDNGVYYWLKVKCPYLENLREYYGLSRQPKYGFHLTIGIAAS